MHGLLIALLLPVHIPVSVEKTPHFGTYKPSVMVGIGNLKPLSMALDTGSTGLRVFSAADLKAAGSGIEITGEATTVTYGNPGRITYHGVICRARLHFGDFVTPEPVAFAYLTSATLPDTNPNGRIPDLNDPVARGGYGVFGIGLTGKTSGAGRVPNPLVTLHGRNGAIYSLRLTPSGGELVLGCPDPVNATEFPLSPGKVEGEKWTLGQAELFVNDRPIGVRATVSFDTGNGVPWLHNVDSMAIPQANGLVKPSTRIGVGAPGGSAPGTDVVAGTAPSHRIKVVRLSRGSPLINVGIEAFLGHVVIYDNTRGVISFAPASAR